MYLIEYNKSNCDQNINEIEILNYINNNSTIIDISLFVKCHAIII